MDFKKSGKAVCALSKLSLGILIVCVVVLVVITAVTTYFVTKDAFDGDDPISTGTTTDVPETTGQTTTTPTEPPLSWGLKTQ